MTGLVRLLAFTTLSLALVVPALAWEVRAYRCTNIMGGNPFRLTFFESGDYMVVSYPESRHDWQGDGTYALSETRSSYKITGGFLLDTAEIDTIHIMSPTRLTPSGSNGLFECIKAK